MCVDRPDKAADGAARRADIEAMLDDVGRLPDRDIDLAGTALLLAALDRLETSLDGYRDHLATLVAETSAPADAVAAGCVAALNATIVERHGYRGDHDTYDDPQNADLTRVIDRRKGLPVALGILYIHVARGQGWHMVGMNFPGHFLLLLGEGGGQAVVDPFNGGRILDARDLHDLAGRVLGAEARVEPAYLRAVGNRDILLRLLNNIKLRAIRERQDDRVLTVLGRMALIAPRSATTWREIAALESGRGNIKAAITALETFHEYCVDAGEQDSAAELLRQLKTRLN